MSEGNITGRIYEGPAKEKIQYVRGTESRFNITKKKKKNKEDYTMVAVLLVIK